LGATDPVVEEKPCGFCWGFVFRILDSQNGEEGGLPGDY